MKNRKIIWSFKKVLLRQIRQKTESDI